MDSTNKYVSSLVLENQKVKCCNLPNKKNERMNDNCHVMVDLHHFVLRASRLQKITTIIVSGKLQVLQKGINLHSCTLE